MIFRLERLLLLCVLGCGLFTPKLHVVVLNGISGDVDHVIVTFAGHDVAMGPIPAGAHVSYGPIATDVPDDASVAWQTVDGRAHTQRISVKSRVSENRSGDVVFAIVASDRIEVSFKAR